MNEIEPAGERGEQAPEDRIATAHGARSHRELGLPETEERRADPVELDLQVAGAGADADDAERRALDLAPVQLAEPARAGGGPLDDGRRKHDALNGLERA